MNNLQCNTPNRRCMNFSEKEISTLTELVDKYNNILENKKTDAVSAKEKDSIWEKISLEWMAYGYSARTGKQLREKWKNVKKEVKKKFSDEKQEVYKTGGGKSKIINISPLDIKVKSLIGDMNVTGLSNVYDSDEILDQQNNEQIEVSENTEPLAHSQSQPISDCENAECQHTGSWANTKWKPSLLKQPISSALTLKNVNEADKLELSLGKQPISSAFTPKNLNEAAKLTAKSNPNAAVTSVLPGNRVILKLSSNNSANTVAIPAHPTTDLKEVNLQRRTVRTVPASQCPTKKRKGKTDLTEDCRRKINVLSETKIELIKLQMECTTNEEKRKNELHELQIKILNREHELKLQQSREIHMFDTEKKKLKLKY